MVRVHQGSPFNYLLYKINKTNISVIFKNLKKKIYILLLFIFFINIFTLDENSNVFLKLKKTFTGVYHYLGFYDTSFSTETLNDKDENILETINANSFDIEVFYSKNLKFDGKSAALFIDNNDDLLFYDQKGYLIKNNKITKLDLTSLFTPESNGGLKGIFFVKDKVFGFVTSRSINCYKSSLIAIKSKNILFETSCLPEESKIDYNGIGGASLVLNNKVYLTIGAPEASSQQIRNLSQDKLSYYGKILEFNANEIYNEDIKFLEILSYGHRNPQGLINYNDNFFSTEHGPYGGDELNIILKDNNYGWPLSSYGTKYFRNDVDNGKRGSGESFFPSHIDNGFVEPLYTFIPSEAISDLTQCPKVLKEYYSKPCLLLSSLKAGSLFVVILDNNMKRVVSIEKIIIGLRLRHFAKNIDNTNLDNNDHIYVSADTEGVLKISFSNFR